MILYVWNARIAPKHRPGVDPSKFWILSRKQMERMVKTVDPSIPMYGNTPHWYVLKNYKEIERVSGIHLFGCKLQGCNPFVKYSHFKFYYSKKCFNWDKTKRFPVPRDESKYVMSKHGWEWKAEPIAENEWSSTKQFVYEGWYIEPPKPWVWDVAPQDALATRTRARTEPLARRTRSRVSLV